VNTGFRRYLIRRLGFAVLLVFAVSSASLLLARVAPSDDAFGTDPKGLYFTAGIDGENHGLFGVIQSGH